MQTSLQIRLDAVSIFLLRLRILRFATKIDAIGRRGIPKLHNHKTRHSDPALTRSRYLETKFPGGMQVYWRRHHPPSRRQHANARWHHEGTRTSRSTHVDGLVSPATHGVTVLCLTPSRPAASDSPMMVGQRGRDPPQQNNWARGPAPRSATVTRVARALSPYTESASSSC